MALNIRLNDSAPDALRDFELYASALTGEMAEYARACAAELRSHDVQPSTPYPPPPVTPKEKHERARSWSHNRLGCGKVGLKGVSIAMRKCTMWYESQLRTKNTWHRKVFKCQFEAARQYDVWSWDEYHDLTRLNYPENYR